MLGKMVVVQTAQEVADIPSLEVFKVKLEGPLHNLIYCLF